MKKKTSILYIQNKYQIYRTLILSLI